MQKQPRVVARCPVCREIVQECTCLELQARRRERAEMHRRGVAAFQAVGQPDGSEQSRPEALVDSTTERTCVRPAPSRTEAACLLSPAEHNAFPKGRWT